VSLQSTAYVRSACRSKHNLHASSGTRGSAPPYATLIKARACTQCSLTTPTRPHPERHNLSPPTTLVKRPYRLQAPPQDCCSNLLLSGPWNIFEWVAARDRARVCLVSEFVSWREALKPSARCVRSITPCMNYLSLALSMKVVVVVVPLV
jgi:hypothetical protein